jgi:hypothetical protein
MQIKIRRLNKERIQDYSLQEARGSQIDLQVLVLDSGLLESIRT